MTFITRENHRYELSPIFDFSTNACAIAAGVASLSTSATVIVCVVVVTVTSAAVETAG